MNKKINHEWIKKRIEAEQRKHKNASFDWKECAARKIAATINYKIDKDMNKWEIGLPCSDS